MIRLFKWMDADWEQFKALFLTSVRIDFRGRRVQGKKKLSPVLRSLIFYGLMGAFVAANLAGNTTPFFYSLLILSYSMVMMVFSVIIELGHTIMNPEDSDVLLHRPLSPRTYFLARFFNLLFFIGTMGLALCLLPALIGIWVKGSSFIFFPVFLFVSLLANVTVGGAVLLFYALLLRIMRFERMKDVLAYMQIGFAFVLFFFYQTIPRLAAKIGTEQLLTKAWLYAAPSAWYSGLIRVLMGASDPVLLRLAVIGISVFALLTGFGFRRISMQYTGLISEQQSRAGKKQPEVGSVREKKGVHTLSQSRLLGFESGAGFQIVGMLLRRDRTVKLTLLPVLGIPLAMILLGIVEGGLPDPFDASPFAQGGYTVMVQGFIFFMIYYFVKGIEYSQHWQASWIYYTAPIESPGKFFIGVKSAILLYLVLPFFAILGIIYGTQISAIHALQHTLILLLMALNAFAVVSMLTRTFPFSKKREKGERAQRFAFMLVVMPFLAVSLLLQTAAYRTETGWLWLAAGLILSFGAFETVAVKRLDRRLASAESG